MVIVNSKGQATIIGEIAPPKEFILFAQKDWEKRLFKVEARGGYGIPVVGQVFEDVAIIASLLTRFDTLRNEAFRGSESLALIERMCEEWKTSGARAATQATTEESA